ncbi:MAG: hypothetical protein JOY68_08285, partial [Candidatus Dormibacteraeota bacterium]|nr:hypothetical protein [Candidatus Dormibacteraeota bacterium]
MRRCTAEAVAAAAAVFFAMTALPVAAGAQVSGSTAPPAAHKKHQGPPVATPSPLPAPTSSAAPTPAPTPPPPTPAPATQPAEPQGTSPNGPAAPQAGPAAGSPNPAGARRVAPNPLFDLAAAQAPPIEALTPVRSVSFGDALQVGPLLLAADVAGLGVLCYLVRR